MANRHGFICGATGTGKTVTLKVLAESFSAMGVPVFLADVKGDLSGMSQPGQDSADMQDRAKRFGLAEDGFAYQGFPTQYFDIYGKRGIPLRTTVSEIGPQLLAGILGLNKTQADILSVVYKLADDENLLLCDTKDLKAILQFAGENAAALESEYGRIAKQSVAAIVRAIVALRGRRRGPVLRRARDQRGGFLHDRPFRQGDHQRAGFQQPHQPAAAVFRLYALPAVRAVRGPARSGGYGQL